MPLAVVAMALVAVPACTEVRAGCEDPAFYRVSAAGGECVTWQPASWRHLLAQTLAAVGSVQPIIEQAADESLPMPDAHRIRRAQVVLGDAEQRFPQIPIEVSLAEAPGHHTVRFHAYEAVSSLRYGLELMGAEEPVGVDARGAAGRGREHLQSGLRHLQRARGLLADLDASPGAPSAAPPSARDGLNSGAPVEGSGAGQPARIPDRPAEGPEPTGLP